MVSSVVSSAWSPETWVCGHSPVRAIALHMHVYTLEQMYTILCHGMSASAWCASAVAMLILNYSKTAIYGH